MEAEGTARAWLDAVARRDFETLRKITAPEATMRALLPGGLVELTGSDSIVERLGLWFEEADPFEALETAVGDVAGRAIVRYRLRLQRPGADRLAEVEQHAYLTVTDGRIEWIDLLCSGFRPVEAPREANVVDYDAGSLGCADGLAGQFRQRIAEVTVGDRLRIRTVDPSAKEDLPSLARLMGHTVLSVEDAGDGALSITVERGK